LQHGCRLGWLLLLLPRPQPFRASSSWRLDVDAAWHGYEAGGITTASLATTLRVEVSRLLQEGPVALVRVCHVGHDPPWLLLLLLSVKAVADAAATAAPLPSRSSRPQTARPGWEEGSALLLLLLLGLLRAATSDGERGG
jgi:hypothetical protein